MLLDGPAFLRLLDRIAPDPVLGSRAMGVPAYVAARLGAVENAREGVERGFQRLCAEVDIVACDDNTLNRAIGEIDHEPWFELLARWAAEAIYADPGNGGNPEARSWSEIGYEHGLPEGPSGPDNIPVAEPVRPTLDQHFDAIVIGAGAGGGIVASQLALAGKQVLLVERGRWLDYANSGHRDHLRNHRNPVYGHNTGPDADDGPRILVTPDGQQHAVEPHTVAYGNNAACVGSGTLIYGGQAWRFHPDDFRMASRYGVPDGSSLADWPIGYDELEPWYVRVEQEIGVCGPPGALPHEPSRSAPLPMPPLPRHGAASVLAAAAGRLGLTTTQPPMLINSVPRDDREACIECASCPGFACPSDGKNGTQNTLLPKALASGNLHLAVETLADRIETDSTGKVTGVRLIWEDAGELRHAASAHADIVVVSAGAIETARLLLLSPSAREPEGLGNTSGQVGRHLQGHTYPTAFGIFDRPVHGGKGPGVTIATTDFVHGLPGVVGGAMLADDFIMTPIAFWEQALPPGLPRWGQAPHDFMRRFYRHVLAVKGPVHEIPDPTCRVELDPAVKDKWGRPVARMSGVVHPETTRTAEAILEKAKLWLSAAGASRVWGTPPVPRLSSYQHQAGTCRMGNSPETSVTDVNSRVWGHDNLFIADGSLHPTNGAFNPVLTIMALAFRCADHLLNRLPLQPDMESSR
ncbi:MAG TPA: GMC family oxidoreductase [Devosia sp.]|jgi:choline dehydrogenase-like flavoprotein|uniref:GMC family oxidoreductase n=1 Tax=Devosia sp. TaxID=1871048 RepID=UPI002F958DA4